MKLLSCFLMACSFVSYADLAPVSDFELSALGGQSFINPLDEELVEEFKVNSESYLALKDLALQEQTDRQLNDISGQGVRIIHTSFPTGARSAHPDIGNINFYGRDYRSGDYVDRITDCLTGGGCNGDGSGGWTNASWDSDGDGIPGVSGGNPDFVPPGDDAQWQAGTDGRADDFYYEYDYFQSIAAANGLARAPGTVADSPEDWHFYRVETDALIKIIARIKRISMGGYTANYGSCGNFSESETWAAQVLPWPGRGASSGYALTNNGLCGTGYSNYSSSQGGSREDDYINQANNFLPRNDRSSYFTYDSEMRDLSLGAAPCSLSFNQRATLPDPGQGLGTSAAAYKGHCENEERPFDPFTLKNPYYEIALAPECELFGDPQCDQPGANTDLVFAGYRSGFESASGTAKVSLYSGTGATQVAVLDSTQITCNEGGANNSSGSEESVCNGYPALLSTYARKGLIIYGHRGRGLTSMPRELCVIGGALGATQSSCQPTGTGGEGLTTTINAEDLQGFWSSTVRNDFQWPGQGWFADDSSQDYVAIPDQYRSTLADRDYAGVNTHIPAGGTPHGGTVINSVTEGPLGNVYTRVEIGL